MAFCPYCGKQLNDGEVCSCALTGASAAPAGSQLPVNNTQPVSQPVTPPAAPVQERPAAGSDPPPPSASQPVSRPAEPTPASTASAPQQAPTGTTPVPPPPASGSAQGYSAPQHHNIPQSYSAPQTSYTPPAAPPAKKSSVFVDDIVKPLIQRAKLLLSPSPEQAVERSIKTTDMSWALVYGAYILLGSLAAGFAVPKFAQGMFSHTATYGDMLGALFGEVFWRALLINILTLGIAIVTVMGVCGATKSKLPFARALNLVSIAFVPAAALNALGFLFSFFFPAGTLICGLLSAICTIVIMCSGLSSVCSKKNLWLNVIISSSMVLVYSLILYLFMDGMVSDIISNFMSSLLW